MDLLYSFLPRGLNSSRHFSGSCTTLNSLYISKFNAIDRNYFKFTHDSLKPLLTLNCIFYYSSLKFL